MAAIAAGQRRVGVISTLTKCCVNDSNRFFGEALADPALASPILLPESVVTAVGGNQQAVGLLLG